MSTLITQIERAETRVDQAAEERERALTELSRHQRGESPDWRVLDRPARYRNRLNQLGRHVEADAIADAGEMAFNPFERILGTSQLAGVSFFERGLLAARAVGRVQIRSGSGQVVGFGSGSLVSPRLFITNNHVIATNDVAAASTVQFDFLNALDGPREPVTFRMAPAVFFITDEALDFTVVALEASGADGTALASRGWSPLIASSGKAMVGERVNIIQHPGGERMQVVVRDNRVVGVVDSFLHYMADTQPGSSGSPVFNDQWDMAALHHAGKPKRDTQGRILMTDGKPWTGLRVDIARIAWEANEGIRVSEIVGHVSGRLSNADQIRLWDATESLPPRIDIWDRLSAAPSTPERSVAAPGGPGPTPTVDEQGNPAWLFRLSFGPLGPAPIAPVPAAAAPAAGRVDSADRPASGPAPFHAGAAFADQLVERFGHTGPYYDEAADLDAQRAYWEGIDLNAPPAPLFAQLREHLALTHTTRLSYRRARHEFLYPAIDLHPGGELRNIYSGVPFAPVEAIASEIDALGRFAEALGIEASAQSLDALLENEDLWDQLERSAALPFNCEHVVCQSWFDKRQPMKADIHHLFACRPRCNSFRGNIPYGQFDPGDEAVQEDCGQREGDDKFEPHFGKGAVARATLYFLLRYPGEIGDEPGELGRERAQTLLDWHREFPVDDYERHRNWLTQRAQGNRNPFIDHPCIASIALLEPGFGDS